MQILVINAGSSSVKFSVFAAGAERPLFESELERLESVESGIAQIPGILEKNSISAPEAIGHRVAHGGDHFRDACLIDDNAIAAIGRFVPLAPLHNPPNLAGIRMARQHWPKLPQVAVFDTAFHQSMPQHAVTYAVPEAWRAMGVRRYGFHGTSHQYILLRAAEELKVPPETLRIISCHLGNGASVCAISGGVSVDTSMGMTALEGLVMGTRSGDVDPGLFGFLNRTAGLTAEKMEDALYHESGLAALSGLGNDMRDIEKAAAAGNANAQLALDVYAYRLRKYIGAYAAALGGCDVLAFTGGIGEHSAAMRQRVCEGMEYMGLALDENKNAGLKLDGYEMPQLQRAGAGVKIMAAQAREQWMIAQEVVRVAS